MRLPDCHARPSAATAGVISEHWPGPVVARRESSASSCQARDDGAVIWLPPKSGHARTEWAKAHPWIAGCYFGLGLGLGFPALLAMGGGSIQSVALLALLAGIAGALLWPPYFRLAVKNRWGERPNAEAHPVPTYRRMWSRTSDRWLTWIMVLVVAAGVQTAISLVTGTGGLLLAVIFLFVSAFAVIATWAERRRRRN